MSPVYYIEVQLSSEKVTIALDRVPTSNAKVKFINPKTRKSETIHLPSIVVAHSGDLLVSDVVRGEIVL